MGWIGKKMRIAVLYIKFLRRIKDAEKYRNNKSAIFANKITIDVRWNAIGGFRRLWKVDQYQAFYDCLGELLTQLRAMHWQVRFLYLSSNIVDMLPLFVWNTYKIDILCKK